ncbi:hypothetical protein MNEG_9459, partial [Monoraphidium neglectum]
MAAGQVMPGVLKVLIEGARDTDVVAPGGAEQQHPFYVLECGNQRSRSKPARGAHPVWNVAHKFALANEMMMRLTLKDDGTKAVIGEALIDLS